VEAVNGPRPVAGSVDQNDIVRGDLRKEGAWDSTERRRKELAHYLDTEKGGLSAIRIRGTSVAHSLSQLRTFPKPTISSTIVQPSTAMVGERLDSMSSSETTRSMPLIGPIAQNCKP